jgi:hypothetical protein
VRYESCGTGHTGDPHDAGDTGNPHHTISQGGFHESILVSNGTHNNNWDAIMV